MTDENISGFNIGMNIGEDAGQTVFHFHIHIIPREKGTLRILEVVLELLSRKTEILMINLENMT